MSTLDILNLFTIWFFLISHLSYTRSSDENPNLRYIGQEDDPISKNERFQQIMQSAPDTRWKEPKLKADKIDVKTELENLNISYAYEAKWPDQLKKLGAVAAVSFDKIGNVVIFHRVDRIWTENTFDLQNNFKERNRDAIQDNTVVAFDRKTGKVVYEWGKKLFYMPHGLTIDNEDNAWVTDVALHQVMKFGPKGSLDKPKMVLGTAFKPGKSSNKFCKPTSVAVLPNGDFFVADGYCNARIVKFSKSGELLLSWGQNSFQGDAYEVAPKNFFAIPHALTLANNNELVCVADRENGRIQCFNTTNGDFYSQYHSEIIGDRLFSVDYAPVSGGQLFVVNGPIAGFSGKSNHYNEVRGFVIEMKTKQVLSKFGPNDMEFSNPHDIIVTKDGDEIYVAELNPNRIHKFVSKRLVKGISLSTAAKPTATIDASDVFSSELKHFSNANDIVVTSNKSQPGSTALLIISLIVVFSLLAFGLALLISRRRKRGLLHTYSTNYLIFSSAE